MSNCCRACGCVPPCRPHCQNIQFPKLETFLRPKPCFCTGSELDYEDLPCLISRPKKRTPSLNTLGTTIGVVKTQLLLKSSDMSNTQVGVQRFATYLKAFAYLYLSPEYEWNTNALNLILKEGQKLYSESQLEEPKESNDEEKADTPEEMQPQPISNVYSGSEAKVERTFQLLGNDFGIELSEHFSLKEPLPGSSGDHLAPIVRMEHLKKMLKEFFKKKNYCLLTVNGWYALIWKSKQIYFVLDVCGRRLDTFETDKDNGAAVLICLSSLDNVIHLITNLSGFGSGETCTIRQMKVVMMGGPDGTHLTPEYGERKDEFVIVSSDYAYLKSALHLSLKTESPLRSRSALPVGVAALLAAKIDHPATWTEKVLNRIICYGVSVCRFCWEQCLRSTEPIDFDCFPNQFRLGQFLVSFLLQPMKFEGTWKCVPNHKQADLRQAFEELFELGSNNLLIQINQQIYSVWRKNNFIYLLDPYRHRVIPADATEPRMASMRVFRTLDAFLDIFNLILLSSNRTSQFYVHTVQVKKIDLVNTKDCVIVTEEAQSDEAEVKSLNEAICFMIDDVQCLEELGGFSDDEEEDSLEEEEVPESESEPEVGEEEGEGGGAVEDIADIESSDDGGVDNRRNRNKNMGSTKKRKGGEKKKKRKRDMSERNKKSRQDSGKNETLAQQTKDEQANELNRKSNMKADMKNEAKGETKGDLRDDNKGITKTDTKEDTRVDTKSDPKGTSLKIYEQPKPPKEKLSIDEKYREPKETKIQHEHDSAVGSNEDIQQKDLDNDFDVKLPLCRCRPSGYPGHSYVAHDMAVVASESGCYDSLCNLIRTGFNCADRVLTITPHGNFVVFRCNLMCQKRYYLFDGCTCNVDKFRHLDLNCGTEGLICFKNLHDTIRYMIDTRTIRTNLKRSRKHIIDKFCRSCSTKFGTPKESTFCAFNK